MFHVKDGFDAKMRDLYNQIILSSERLQSDIKNSRKSNYLEGQIQRFNNTKENLDKGIALDYDKLYTNMSINKYKIVFVMAFNSDKKSKNELFNLRLSNIKSNIAKYALVQTVKEIDGFSLNIIDLADL